MTRVKSFAGLGSVLPADLNTIQDDYEQVYRQWRPVLQGSLKSIQSQNALNEYIFTTTGNGVTVPLTNNIATDKIDGSCLFYWDPSEYEYSGRTMALRLRSSFWSPGGITSTGTFVVNVTRVTGLATGLTDKGPRVILGTGSGSPVQGLVISHANVTGQNMQTVQMDPLNYAFDATGRVPTAFYVVTGKWTLGPINTGSRTWCEINLSYRVE